MKLFYIQIMVLFLLLCISPIILAENDVVLTQDLEYINSNLQDVIRDLAEIGGFRVILDRQVRGDVSLTLMHGVTAKEAIATVARGYGYSSRWLNASALMVGTSAFINGNFAARSTRIHTLKNADPVLVAEKLQTVIPRERIKIDHATNELTVTADIAEHQNISDLINQLDRTNTPINLEIRIEEVTDNLWKMLQLETGWLPTELGAAILNAEQQKIITGNSNRLLLGRSDLTCFNNQEAKVLFGDYLPKSAFRSNGNPLSVEEFESGTRLVLTPSMTGAAQLQLKINNAVKMVSNNKVTLIRGIHSVIGVNLEETILFNGILQRNEFLNLKKTATGYQYPILENLFEQSIGSESGQSTRVILLITPRLADRTEKVEVKGESPATNQYNTINNTQVNLPVPVESPAPNGVEIEGSPDQELPAKPIDEKPVLIFDAVVVPENQPDNVRNLSPDSGQSEIFEIKYLVKKGDTPTGIAKKYGVELSAMMANNNLTNTDVIKVGSVLKIGIPSERIYVVKPKETLWRIAKRYGVAIEVLMDLNGIDDQTKVKQGQALVLPVSSRNVVNPQF